MLSLKDVEDSLEKFSGDDLLSVNQWVKDFEEMAEVCGWSDAHVVTYAKKLLAGSAQAFVRQERCAKFWAKLKRALRNEFENVVSAQQHEDDLEQLVGFKKQLEKKLADAYEEVEEQRQVVGQWKRRVQSLNGEMHDLRLLLEEQTARNNLLEKKQRKFDSETQNLMNDLRQEKAQRKRLAREKEIAIAE
ncbi:unconventional myosin-XVIIIa-like [Bombus vosnesenskii]|uniref:Unconventional myosin-XVIIIa-like n=1 Tax=Bombus vosnesenskii TaxID=207650 RepID=A0A6J3LCS6_9HYME|nr:unconventional myosin-XVIIIa-like [Bombus vosnesenskii]XP_033362997.1 unconventional myosin-XVIIIa-like [Bombus vosnesenskii]